MGHQVSGAILKPETGKDEVIMVWPTPQTKSKSCHSWEQRAKPLTDLIKKKLPKVVTGTPECEKAFQALKKVLGNAPVLQAPDFT